MTGLVVIIVIVGVALVGGALVRVAVGHWMGDRVTDDDGRLTRRRVLEAMAQGELHTSRITRPLVTDPRPWPETENRDEVRYGDNLANAVRTRAEWDRLSRFHPDHRHLL